MVAKSNGVKAKKYLGQHFLEDPSVAERIAAAVQTDDSEACILEIGPGTGALTRPLIQRFLVIEVLNSQVLEELLYVDCIPKLFYHRVKYLR